jgi:two-component system sensor histidine kinase DesK
MQPDRESPRGVITGLAWTVVWMWLLIDPLQSIVHGKVHPVALAATGFAVYAVLYVVCVVAGFRLGVRAPGRGHLLLLGTFAILGVTMAAAYAGRSSGWLSLLLYVGAAGAAVLSRPGVYAWIVAAPAALVVIGLVHHQPGGDVGATAFSTFMGCALVFTVKQLIGYVHQLRDTQAELARVAVTEERLRFSRDLHELLGHTLTLIVVKAQVARRLAERDPAATASAAADIEQIGRQALVEVREAVTGYRERAFATELDGARTALTDAGIEVSITQVGTPLPEVADTIFGWAVREAATNIIRHSGARHCHIVVRRADAGATLEVHDDGVGGTVNGGGNGLRGVRERLTTAGGTLSAAPAAEGGFRLVATLPAGGYAPGGAHAPGGGHVPGGGHAPSGGHAPGGRPGMTRPAASGSRVDAG